MAPPSADDLTVMDMLDSMNDAELAEFVHQHRDRVTAAILVADWSDELAEFQQRVRDGEFDARYEKGTFEDSKGVPRGR